MLIIGTFEHTIEMEEALSVLEKSGVPRSSIMAVSMDETVSRSDVTATRYPHKQTLAFEIGMALATAFSVVGISFGFVSDWGPIIWGIVSALAGFMLGAGGTCWMQRTYLRGQAQKGPLPELVVIIRCTDASFPEIRLVLQQYRALSIGRIEETG
ncbi:hypothetical protein PAESOLCIP111_01487 [Paenibacillus solanacearum]|uniref:Uncharacterized protein n=1 Tax=Paenibacillus solanacearum TaxID=2048548 RepID=A0A916JZ49_9BACL|nr:hypothetical protein [Paenibacillus solanacearum]CAG7612134.1 hypothetical protein PAESOLCIP111_01487 [Paenibacillus solanacearum]